MSSQLERSIVRIKNYNGIAVGAGFLVNDKTVLTCAHVVAQALGISNNTKPTQSYVNLDIPLVNPGLNLTARVIFWSQESEGDIAGLELADKLPKGTQCMGLANVEDLWGHNFRAFGYPVGIDGGVWASGVLRGRQDQGWVQIEDVKGPGHRIEPGYSGTPVWDDEMDAIVGIVVAAEIKPENKVAFIIPTITIIETWPNLEKIIQAPTASLAKLINVPELPANFLLRSEYMGPIKKSLLSKDYQKVAITSLQRIGLWGMGGIGKSVIAAAISLDEDIRKTFLDGIIWLTIGQKPDLIARQLQLAKSLGEKQCAIVDIQDGRVYLSELLIDKACLIILDDVWEYKDAEAFDVASEHSKILITTRKIEIIRSFDAVEHTLGLLNEDEALTLLATRSNHDLATLPNKAKDIAKECGNLPLALAMVGSMARGKTDDIWENILYRLRTADLEKIRRYFKGYEHDTLFKAIEVSVDDLEPELRKRYLELAVFPDDTPISEKVLSTFWGPEGLSKYDVQDAINLFSDRSLAQIDEKGRLKLHDLQLDYTRAKISDLTEMYNKLLKSYSLKCSDSWPSGPNDGFFFEHLTTILNNAGRRQELQKLLLEPRWLKAKLNAIGANVLASDYDLFKDEDMKMVQGAIRLSAHIVEYDKAQLTGQLIGRLGGIQSSKIKKLLEDFQCSEKNTWLHPLTPSLIPPGHGLIMTLRSNVVWISAIAVSADGKLAIIGSFDGTLKVWDLMRRKELKTLTCKDCWVSAVAIIADNKLAVSGHRDGTVIIWDLENGKEIKKLKGHAVSINAIAATVDGKIAISVSNDGVFKVWDVFNGKVLNTSTHHVDRGANAITADGKFAVSGTFDGMLRVWDLKYGKEPITLVDNDSSIKAVAVTVDGKLAVSGNRDGTVKVWDLDNRKELKTLMGHAVSINAVAITEDGKIAISGSSDGLLKVWDLESSRDIGSLTGHSRCINVIALTADGKFAVSGTFDGMLRVWDLKYGKEPITLVDNDSSIKAVAVTVDGKLAVSGNRDGTVKVWDLDNRKELKTLMGHAVSINAVAITEDGKIAISGSSDGLLKVWDLESSRDIGSLTGHSRCINVIALTADGKLAVSWSLDGMLKIWNLESVSELKTYIGSVGWDAKAVTADGLLAVSASSGTALTVYNWINKKELKTFKGHEHWVYAVAITADGKLIVSWSEDGIVKVWDVVNGNELKTIRSTSDIVYKTAKSATSQGRKKGKSPVISINAVAVTADGKFAVSGYMNSILKIWNLEKGEELKTISSSAVQFSNALDVDGIVSGSKPKEKTLRIWDKESKKVLEVDTGYPTSITAAVATPNSKLAVSGHMDGMLMVWDIKNQQKLASYLADATIKTCAITDSMIIIAGDSLGRMHFLKLQNIN